MPLLGRPSGSERGKSGHLCPEGSAALCGTFRGCRLLGVAGAVLAERSAWLPGPEWERRDEGGGANRTGMNAQSPL